MPDATPRNKKYLVTLAVTAISLLRQPDRSTRVCSAMSLYERTSAGSHRHRETSYRMHNDELIKIVRRTWRYKAEVPTHPSPLFGFTYLHTILEMPELCKCCLNLFLQLKY